MADPIVKKAVEGEKPWKTTVKKTVENVSLDSSEFTKISFNVPKKLLKEFDQIAILNHYSRVEAIKEAMRRFIEEQTPENYSNAEDMENAWRSMYDAILKVSQDPKYKKLNIDPNSAIARK